jgi:hypothetical protein
MRIWKFVVPGDRFYALPSDPDFAYKGCIAVAVAESEDAARAIIAADGDDARWLEVARVSSYPVNVARIIAFAML